MAMAGITSPLGMGLIAGVLAGTTVGLLCAPKPGKETRALIRQKTAGYVGALRGRISHSGAPVAAPTQSQGEGVSSFPWPLDPSQEVVQ